MRKIVLTPYQAALVARFDLVVAMRQATSASASSIAARGHLGLGKLYRRTGKPEQAHEHLTTATSMYREMDMRFWLEQAEAELKVLK